MNTLQQLSFEVLESPVEPEYEREATIQERFEAFHRANPHVYAALKNLALQMLRKGVRQYGMSGLFEILRWQFALQTKGEPFKLNNDFRSRYTRLLMQQEPELQGFFETRTLRERGTDDE